MKRVFVLCLALIGYVGVNLASPPKPPIGFRWVLQEEFSDEFNGKKLDASKWYDYYQPGWEGRAPARFEPKAISLNKGNLEIKSGVLEPQKGPFTMYGGAVVSKKYAHFGYYECRFKASKIAMSTTFWMSNDKVPLVPGNCETDSYSQELDIQEAVGGGTVHDKFRNGMNSNTHYRYIKCGERKETFISKGAGTTLKSEVSDEYHTYGAWWINPEEVKFYADNEFFEMVKVSKEVSQKPFDRPMHINMVTETYDWQPAPSNEDLMNDAINTAYYDWIRAFKLVPVQEKFKHTSYEAELYENMITIYEVTENIFDTNTISFLYNYANNEDGKIIFQIIENKDDTPKQEEQIAAFQGFGCAKHDIKIKFKPSEGENYKIKAILKNKEGQMLKEVKYDVSR